MENSLLKLENKAKGLFDQKGGTLGMVILALGVVFLILKLPAIVAFVDSLLHLMIVSAAVAGILYVAFDKKVRRIVGTLYMMGIRSLMGMVIKMNPIAILEDTISQMYKSIANVEEKMAKLNGIRLKFKQKIKEKKKELQDCLDRKKAAQERGKKELEILEDRQSVRLVALTQEYIDLQASSERWYSTLSKLAEMAKITAQDAENEVAAQKERYEMIKASHSAFKSAMSIIKGDPDDLAMYNQAFQFVNDDIMDKIGEMDRIINTTGGMLDKMDLEKEIFAIKGNDISKKYEELGIESLFTKFEALPSKQINDFVLEENMYKSNPVVEKSRIKYF